MKPKYKINQEVYFMHNGRPMIQKVIGALETINRTFYIIPTGSDINEPDRFWLCRNIKDGKTVMLAEKDVFATSAALQKSVFKDLE